MEAIARRLRDPVLLSWALRERSEYEGMLERLDVADRLADDALHWARVAGDDWEIAATSRMKATAASGIAELRERVDTSAALLAEVGNVHDLAAVLTTAAYVALSLDSTREGSAFAARATPIVQTVGSRMLEVVNSGNVGLAQLFTGNTDTASAAFREELRLCREMVVRPLVFEGLRGLAAVAVADGDDERAATLVGAAAARRYHNPDGPIEAKLDQTYFAPARTRFGAPAWDAVTGDGTKLSFEDAIAYGLSEPPARRRPPENVARATPTARSAP